jgi:hypothetical protein
MDKCQWDALLTHYELLCEENYNLQGEGTQTIREVCHSLIVDAFGCDYEQSIWGRAKRRALQKHG